MNLSVFLNDNFKILKCLIDNEVVIQGKKTVRLTQGQIAKELKMSKSKVNTALNLFIDKGYLKMVGAGNYTLYKSGRDIYYYLCQKEINSNDEDGGQV